MGVTACDVFIWYVFGVLIFGAVSIIGVEIVYLVSMVKAARRIKKQKEKK